MMIRIFKHLQSGSSALCSRPSLLVVWGLGIVLCLCPPAVAGQWQLDRYEVFQDEYYEVHNGLDVQTYHSDGVDNPIPMPYPRRLTLPAQSPIWIQSYLAYDLNFINGVRQASSPSGRTFCSVTVTPIFKWHPTGAQDSPTPYLLLAEWGKAEAFLSHGRQDAPYTQEHPYTGQNFTLVSLSNGMENLAQNLNSFGVGYFTYPSGAVDYNTRRTNLDKVYLQLLPTGGGPEVRGPTRTLGGSATSTGWNTDVLGLTNLDGAGASVNAHYRAWVGSATLSVRRVGAQVVTPEHPEGQLAPFTPSTSIAAGFQRPVEHKAEVQLQLSPPLQGFDLTQIPRIQVQEIPAGVERMGLFARRRGGITDENGRGVMGIFKSSDLIKNLTLAIPDLAYVTSAGVSQGITGEWHMGENGELPWNPDFVPGQAKTVVFKAKLEDLPIKSHTLRFFVTRLKLCEWEDESKTSVVERIYLLDDPDMDIPNETGAIRKPASFFTPYVSLGETTVGYADVTDAADGIYKTTYIAKKSEDWSVEDLQLGFKDLGTFKKRNP